jgi:hypothetical protein
VGQTLELFEGLSTCTVDDYNAYQNSGTISIRHAYGADSTELTGYWTRSSFNNNNVGIPGIGNIEPTEKDNLGNSSDSTWKYYHCTNYYGIRIALIIPNDSTILEQ